MENILTKEGHYSFLELLNINFQIEKTHKKCVVHAHNQTKCEEYKKNYEKSITLYTDCLLANKKEYKLCDEYKMEYEKCRDIYLKDAK